jgi:hypothetical protein
VGAGLLGRGKPRADPHSVRAGRQRCCHRAPRPDPARRQHGHRHCVEHLAEEWKQPDRATHVATRFDALGNDEVAACLDGKQRLLTRANRPRGEGATSMDDLDQLRVRVCVKELDDPGDLRSLCDARGEDGTRVAGRRKLTPKGCALLVRTSAISCARVQGSTTPACRAAAVPSPPA